MVISRGGISGGLTIADALREFEQRGYVGQFGIREGGAVECASCQTQHRPKDISVEAMRRIEGVSDPDDMVFVGALRCPNCGNTGTATIKYGPEASRDEVIVLREIDHDRLSTDITKAVHDPSLVSDTGWMDGPDGR